MLFQPNIYWNYLLLQMMCRYRDDYLNRGLAPEGESLSFASPKESNQRKGDPVATLLLRSSLSTEVDERDSCPFANMRHPCRIPHGLFPPKAPVLGAAYGSPSFHRPNSCVTALSRFYTDTCYYKNAIPTRIAGTVRPR
jgi:hypothetical protein